MSQGATISIMMIMIIVVVGLGIYLMNAETCSGPDSNASYKYNDEGECVIDKCNSGYVLEGNVCITTAPPENKTGSCSGPDLNASYKYNDDGDCVFDECNEEYFLQGGVCMKSVDLSAIMKAGLSESTDCTIDGYTFGQCKSTETGEVLTGDQGNCGIGTREKYPNITGGATGGGTCEANTTEDCEVPCRSVCTAPDDLWVTGDNAECRAIRDGQSVVLGSESGYCGQGTKVKTLTLPETTNVEEYKTSINFSSCEPEKVEACSVPCENNLVDVGCPTSLNSWDWVYANNGAVYTEESANQVINRQITFDEAVPMPAVSRQDAINLGALDENGIIINEDKIPKGKKIKFKAGENHSYDYLTEQNCSIVELEDAQAPRVKTDCIITELKSECKNVGCGQPLQKTITPTMTKPAWGDGVCNIPTARTEDCQGQYATSCCDTTVAGDFTAVTGDEGCFLKDTIWKRKYTRTGHPGCFFENKEKFKADSSCNRECTLKSIEFESGGTVGRYYSNRGVSQSTSQARKVKSVEYLEPRANGIQKTCPYNSEIAAYYTTSSGILPQVGDTFNAFDIDTLKSKQDFTVHEDVGDTKFKCGRTYKHPGTGGVQKQDNGLDCGDQNAPPAKYDSCNANDESLRHIHGMGKQKICS